MPRNLHSDEGGHIEEDDDEEVDYTDSSEESEGELGVENEREEESLTAGIPLGICSHFNDPKAEASSLDELFPMHIGQFYRNFLGEDFWTEACVFAGCKGLSSSHSLSLLYLSRDSRIKQRSL